MRRPKFLPVENELHALSRTTKILTHLTRYTRSTPLSAMSALAHHPPRQQHTLSSDVSKQYC